MKAISLWQPWASLWIADVKGYETRHWATSHRGPLLVHAAKKLCVDLEPELLEICDKAFGESWAKTLPRGALLGAGELTGCRRTEECAPSKVEQACGNYTAGRYAWGLARRHQFREPIAYRGFQSLFDVPLDVVAHMLAGGSIEAPPAAPQQQLI